MARLPPLDLPDVPQHIVQRGNNRQALFFHADDYSAYLAYLREALVKNNCKLYEFVLMTNHAHPLAVGEAPGRVSGLMQSVGCHYARYVNVAYRRSGTLFEARFEASLVDSERYLLRRMRYIEINPVRTGLVARPEDYPWSSYGSRAGDAAIRGLTEPEEYRRLAASSEARALAYRDLFKRPLAAYDLEAVRAHLN